MAFQKFFTKESWHICTAAVRNEQDVSILEAKGELLSGLMATLPPEFQL